MSHRTLGRETNASNDVNQEDEPRWPAVIALLATTGLYLALPASLSIGPRWLPFMLVAVLLIPTVLSYRLSHHKLNHALGLSVAVLVTFFMVASLILLVHAMIANTEKAAVMLRSAAALWVTNVLVFSLWYWRLDAGGPHQRDLRPGHTDGAFLFPQMTMTTSMRAEAGEEQWTPHFTDYLFLAFNTSTALSPADTAVLSRWAKLLMMLQAAISLTVVALLASRAVNILNS